MTIFRNPIEPKVQAASISAALSALAIWALSTYVFPTGIPAPLEGAISTLIPAGAAFVAGWLTRSVHNR